MKHPTENENSGENEDEVPKYQDWPVSKSDTRPVNRGTVGSKPAFTVLRIVLWLLPAIVVPVIGLLSSIIIRQMHAHMFINLLYLVLSLVAVAALGYFDYRIALQQKGLEMTRENKKIIGRIVLFIICQIFITPILWYTLIYGYCMVTGSGFH